MNRANLAWSWHSLPWNVWFLHTFSPPNVFIGSYSSTKENHLWQFYGTSHVTKIWLYRRKKTHIF